MTTLDHQRGMQVTILLTDDNPGLQLYLEGGWRDVPPMADAFIINLGDLLERCALRMFSRYLVQFHAVCV